jgi:hypothetical protein
MVRRALSSCAPNIAALQLPYIYLPFPFSSNPASSQYLDTLLSYCRLGLSLVPLSCHIHSFVAVAVVRAYQVFNKAMVNAFCGFPDCKSVLLLRYCRHA